MTLTTKISQAFASAGVDIGTIQTLLNGGATDLSGLSTTAKGNLVAALNEVVAALGSMPTINDSSTGSGSLWSAAKITAAISAQATATKSQILDGAPAALDTLNELAAALNDDEDQISDILTAIGNRVRYDGAQTLTAAQELQACENIGVGNPTTNFLSSYTTARDA